jgi:hypothetical protein
MSIPFSPKADETEVAVQRLEMILAHQPVGLFVHFPGADNAGHACGRASRQQMDAIAEADR